MAAIGAWLGPVAGVALFIVANWMGAIAGIFLVTARPQFPHACLLACLQAVLLFFGRIYLRSILAITNEMPFRRRGLTMTVSTKTALAFCTRPLLAGLAICLHPAEDRNAFQTICRSGDKQKSFRNA